MPLFIQVYEFVGLTDLYYAGSHGMDIMGPVRQSSNDHPNNIRSTDKQVYWAANFLSSYTIPCVSLFLSFLKLFFNLVSF